MGEVMRSPNHQPVRASCSWGNLSQLLQVIIRVSSPLVSLVSQPDHPEAHPQGPWLLKTLDGQKPLNKHSKHPKNQWVNMGELIGLNYG